MYDAITPFFLTESVTLNNTELIQRGILLDIDHPMFEYKGAYTGEKHFVWANLRLACAEEA